MSMPTFWVPVTFYVPAESAQHAARIVTDYLGKAARLIPAQDVDDVDIETANIKEVPFEE